MAWIFSPGSAESVSVSNLGSEPSRTANATDTRKVFCCRECGMVRLIERQSGTTCEPCELNTLWSDPTSSSAASPARTLALPDAERAWRESEAVCFSKSSDWSMNYDPGSSSWKTSQLSLLEDSTSSPVRLPSSGMTVGGQLFQPTNLEPRTSANAGSCLQNVPTATATATDAKSSRNATVKNRKVSGNPGMTLTDYVTLFPTPTATSYGTNIGGGSGRVGKVKHSLETMARHNLWPTPRASEASRGHGGSGNRKENQKTLSQTIGGQLNPMWVEWLQGFPLGWTALDALETQSFQSKQKRRSKGSSGSKAG